MTQPALENWISAEDLGETMRREGTSRLAIQGLLLPEHLRAYQRLRQSQWCLVRNHSRDTGERWSCTRCSGSHIGPDGQKVIDPVFHEFFTLCCVYLPFRGLEDALWGYAQITRDERLRRYLRRLGPNLGVAHPRYASRVDPEALGSIIGVALGLAEPITRDRAASLIRDINARRPPSQLRVPDGL